MQGIILLNRNDNTKQIEDEEKHRFLKSVLQEVGLPINDFWTNDVSLSIEQKIRLREILATYNISVLDDLDGNLQIYLEDELIASWDKPFYKLKRDLREINPKKQFYIEMNINC